MSQGLVLLAQVMGLLSILVLAGAVALIALRSGRSGGEALAYGLGLLFVGGIVPHVLRSVGLGMGLPVELIFLAYPVCGLLSSLLVLMLALLRWPRPQ